MISTHALTEGDKARCTVLIPLSISTHALTEGDRNSSDPAESLENFNSRPHGGRHGNFFLISVCVAFQLTPSRRATHCHDPAPLRCRFQLTPSRRATVGVVCLSVTAGFQLTPSRRATRVVQWAYYQKLFQLTPSRRATLPASSTVILDYFNSRPHGGRRDVEKLYAECTGISTHALTEGDSSHLHSSGIFIISTHALTEGDIPYLTQCFHFRISTHALTEGDRLHGVRRSLYPRISTHALTEGDGKFRQIFLLNRGYAYSISLYFLPHFISLLPQILSFQQKSFKFQVRIFLLFSVHLAFALQNQCVHHVKYRFCTNMFYFVFVLFTQIVKPQTIGLFIYDFF